MHPNSLKLMHGFLSRFLSRLPPGRLLDVGSLDVNGTYRHYIPAGWDYVGLDQVEGPNVDVVAPSIPWPFPDGHFDAVISGQCLEHAERPHEVAGEIGRVLAPGAPLCLIAPWSWEIHRHPKDCWRILPDGMEILLGDAGCDVIEARIDDRDCIGIGLRRPDVEAEMGRLREKGLAGHVL